MPQGQGSSGEGHEDCRHTGHGEIRSASQGADQGTTSEEERKITDTYVHEENPGEEEREYWARQDGPIRHTLEFRDIGDAITIALWSEVTDLDAAEWDSRVELAITHRDAAKMRDRLARICQLHADHHRCDFCFSPDPQWVFSVPRDALSSDASLRGLCGDGRWNACWDCEPHVESRDVPALVSRFITTLRESAHPGASDERVLAEVSQRYANRYERLLALPLDKRPYRP
ncbi:hypothetical protein FH609_002545 [Streptomyces sp. 3MP-14]|uniref:Uncharacterized protein n=1 Tax=Streptomyces mimosae TaxID=2586635 RepID=A0A5N6AE30_9ACTN|nr:MULTISPECIES: hypothetical protein [Streptomyces]KAB8166442.1 hypothetical protein FH607_011495 [Streptomyces mimosae]KAB8178871.1 hypothetical protein FH609_002545 [Streptomyces sp. 3MP-14]